MSELNKFVSSFKDPAMRAAWSALDKHVDAINARIPPAEKVDDPFTPAQNISLPPQAQFQVVGIDGKFKWFIVNPQDRQPQSVALMRAAIANGMNLQAQPIYHNVQSALDTNFNLSSSITDYGITPDLYGESQDPNVTRFFRIRSSFDQQNWNDWQLFQDPALCGPVGVASGFERSTSVAPRSVVNTNNATVDSVDAGANATIRIYGSGGVGSSYTRFDGQGNQITTAGASILGAAYTTQFAIVLNTLLVHLAFPTATQYLKTIADAFFYIATMTTVGAGGGGGSTGGGGNSGGGGTGGGNNKLPQL